jgi:hypothetical protein
MPLDDNNFVAPLEQQLPRVLNALQGDPTTVETLAARSTSTPTPRSRPTSFLTEGTVEVVQIDGAVLS